MRSDEVVPVWGEFGGPHGARVEVEWDDADSEFVGRVPELGIVASAPTLDTLRADLEDLAQIYAEWDDLRLDPDLLHAIRTAVPDERGLDTA